MRRGTAVLAVALAGALGACGGSAPSGTSTGTSTGPSAGTTAGSGTATASATGGAAGTGSPTAGAGSASGCGARLQITVKGSTVTPPPGTTDVRAGCEVDLTITADRTSEVHVHVVDLEKPITAGQPLRISFTPSQQGVYEVELHDPDLLLVKLAVR